MGIISTNQKKATPTTIVINAVTEVHLLRTSITKVILISNWLQSSYIACDYITKQLHQFQHKAAASASTQGSCISFKLCSELELAL